MANKADIANIYGLSPMQEGILFHSILNKNDKAYFEQFTLYIEGEMNIELLEKSFNLLIEKYDVLRTVFVFEKVDKPLQVLLKSRKANLSYEDISHLEVEQKREYINLYKKGDLEKGFDLSKDILARLGVLKTNDSQYVFIWSFHHIIIDGWCLAILLKDFFGFYNSLVKNTPVHIGDTIAYSKYIKWISNQDKGATQEYWTKYLQGYERITTLPKFKGEQKAKDYKLEELSFTLDTEESKSIYNLAKGLGVTVSSVFHCIWGVLLQRYNNTNDIVFGTVVSGRPNEIADIEEIVGLFINTIPVRIKTEADTRFSLLLEQLYSEFTDSKKHEYYPLSQIQVDSRLKQNLLDHIMVFENHPLESSIKMLNKSGEYKFHIKSIEAFEQTNYDFDIAIFPGEEIKINLCFNANVYENHTIERVKGHIKKIVEQIIKNPSILVNEIDILTDNEFKQVTFEFNNKASKCPENKVIHELIDEQSEKDPNRVAIVYGNEQLTYSELNNKATKLAIYLREKGIRNNDIIAIMLEPSVHTIIALLGVLKSGGAYLPIDTKYPDERILDMLEDSGAKLLITNTSILSDKNIDALAQTDTILMNEFLSNDENNKKYSLSNINRVDDLAYIIYTSGSTGKPKGVVIEHRNLVAYVHSFLQEFNITSDDVVLQQASFSFDAFVEEVYPALVRGGKVVISSKFDTQDPTSLANIINENKVTVVSCSPLLLNGLNLQADLRSIRLFISGGDVLDYKYISKLLKYSIVYNTYGPTESTVCASYYKCNVDSTGSVPIGQPISNYKVYILDRFGKPQPIAIAGELCISGSGVCRGYLNRPELTKEKFIDNCFVTGEKIYKSGDLARWLPDGNIEFLGRIDEQVKIRGYRIELGEIHNRLLEYNDINAAMVTVLEGSDGEKHLCAYLASERQLTITEVRNHLLKRLPDFMVPSKFIVLKEFPMMPNGKIDKRALLSITDYAGIECEYVKPSNEIEEKLTIMWANILGVEKVGVKDDFFELGGHSLRAVMLFSRIQKEFDVTLKMSDIFSSPTVQELAELINRAKKCTRYLIGVAAKQEYYPLSSAQNRLFILEQMNEVRTSYNMPGALVLEGNIDKEKIKVSFKRLVERHESLRTSFDVINGEPVQIIHSQVEFDIKFIELDSENDNAFINKFIKPFDLSKAPLLRVNIVKTNNTKSLLLFDMHHIISDGLSMDILVYDFISFYNNKNIDELKIQYKDFAVWQEKIKNSELMKAQEDFWLEALSGELPVLNISTDYQRPSVQSYEGDHFVFKCDLELADKLRDIASSAGVTQFIMLLAIYNIFLSKYSAQEDIIVGTPTAGRPTSELDGVIGMFVNTIALRNYPKRDMSFIQFLNEVKSGLINAYERQDYQFEDLVDKLNIRRDLSRNPVFDTMFSLQDSDLHKIQLNDLKIQAYELENKVSKFDFSLEATVSKDSINFELIFCTRLFKKETIEKMSTHFINIIREISSNPNIKLSEIYMISDEERNKQLFEFNNTSKNYKDNRPIYKMVEDQAKNTPADIAVEFEDEFITYNELNCKANYLASYLASKGIGKGSYVPVLMDRSIELVVSILAIMKSGAGFVPIDIYWPIDRIKDVLIELGCRIALVNKYSNLDSTILGVELYTVYRSILCEQNKNIDIDIGSDDPIYIIYTSGSTGKPKGVVIPNRGITNRFLWMNDYFGKEASRSVLQTTNHVYDSAVWQLFWPLTNGGKTVIPSPQMKVSAEYISYIIEKRKVTLTDFVPSVFNVIVEQLEESVELHNKLNSLRSIIIGGEEIVPATIARFRKLFPDVQISNFYGPTEASIGCIYYEVTGEEGNKIPIGKPISNVNILILDKNLKLVPIGVPGEIYISGICLGNGYFNDMEKTSAVFIENPFKELGYELMYKTGDLAKYLPSGDIDFLGRVDFQVKIRGFRIELGEIESQMLNYEGIKEGVVLARENSNGVKYLCAYIIADRELNISQIKEYLSKKLPYYMIPQFIIQLNSMPLSQSGKVNRKMLPEPNETEGMDREYVAPSNKLEETLVVIWQEVLKVNRVGVTDDFFELGGHSLKAANLVSKLNKALSVEIPIREIFNLSSIRELAKYIQNIEKSQFISIKPVEKRDFYPVSAAQLGLLVLEQFEGISTSYNMPEVLILKGSVDKQRIENAFKALIQRHETLRTSFEYIDGSPAQRVHDDIEFSLEYFESNQEEVNSIIRNYIRPFDLSSCPLLRVALIKVSKDKHVLIADMHHIITDGISSGILINDFISLYESRELPELKIQFKDYAVWQNDNLKSGLLNKQEEFWIKSFTDNIPWLNIPTDYPRALVQNFEGETISIEIGKELTEKIKFLVNQTGTTLYILLLSAYNILLFKYTGQEDIIVGSPTAGRKHADLENVIGMFVNTLPIRSFPRATKSFYDFLHEVKDNALKAFEYQDYPLQYLVKKLNLKRESGRNLLFDTMFAVLNTDVPEIHVEGLKITPYKLEDKQVKYDLILTARERDEVINLNLEYCTKLFMDETAKKILHHFVCVLENIVKDVCVYISDIELLSDKEKELVLNNLTESNNCEDANLANHLMTRVLDADFDF